MVDKEIVEPLNMIQRMVNLNLMDIAAIDAGCGSQADWQNTWYDTAMKCNAKNLAELEFTPKGPKHWEQESNNIELLHCFESVEKVMEKARACGDVPDDLVDKKGSSNSSSAARSPGRKRRKRIASSSGSKPRPTC
jgi:hypothetical protein